VFFGDANAVPVIAPENRTFHSYLSFLSMCR